jgi:hypothetical protein
MLAVADVQNHRHGNPYSIFEQFLCSARSKESSTLARMRYRWSLDVIICRAGLTLWTTVTENGLALPVFSFRCLRLISSWLILTSILASPRDAVRA